MVLLCIIIKKRCYWSKNIPYNITDALKIIYRSYISRTYKISNIDLTICSIHNCKNIVLLSSCFTTILGSEIK